MIGRGDLVFRQGRVPLIGNDRLPDQPESLPGVHEQTGIGVRKAGRISHEERLTPRRAGSALARAKDFHVICIPLARAVVPANQQIAIGAFDDAWRVVMLVVQREHQLRLEARESVRLRRQAGYQGQYELLHEITPVNCSSQLFADSRFTLNGWLRR